MNLHSLARHKPNGRKKVPSGTGIQKGKANSKTGHRVEKAMAWILAAALSGTGKPSGSFRAAKRPEWQRRMNRLATRNGPFGYSERTVWLHGMGRLATRNEPFGNQASLGISSHDLRLTKGLPESKG